MQQLKRIRRNNIAGGGGVVVVAMLGLMMSTLVTGCAPAGVTSEQVEAARMKRDEQEANRREKVAKIHELEAKSWALKRQELSNVGRALNTWNHLGTPSDDWHRNKAAEERKLATQLRVKHGKQETTPRAVEAPPTPTPPPIWIDRNAKKANRLEKLAQSHELQAEAWTLRRQEMSGVGRRLNTLNYLGTPPDDWHRNKAAEDRKLATQLRVKHGKQATAAGTLNPSPELPTPTHIAVDPSAVRILSAPAAPSQPGAQRGEPPGQTKQELGISYDGLEQH